MHSAVVGVGGLKNGCPFLESKCQLCSDNSIFVVQFAYCTLCIGYTTQVSITQLSNLKKYFLLLHETTKSSVDPTTHNGFKSLMKYLTFLSFDQSQIISSRYFFEDQFPSLCSFVYKKFANQRN